MKVALLFIAFLLFHSSFIQAQCSGSNDSNFSHEIDDLTILHRTNMTLYSEAEGEMGAYLTNSDNEKISLIYQGGLWMGGIDENEELRVSAKQYDDFEGFSPGIIDDATGSVSSSSCEDWDRVFMVNVDELESFIQDFEDNGTIDNTIPDNILYYPAIGNENFSNQYGFDLPTDNIGGLAVFKDQNNNGKYEPQKGDHPLIRGTESAFWIGNDLNQNNDDGIGMEFHIVSSINKKEPELAFTSMMKIKAIYKGNSDLKDFYIGNWIDGDLGCYETDMVGCLPDENVIFYYGIEDESCSSSEPFPTGTTPLLLFKYNVNDGEKMSSFISINNPSSTSSPDQTTQPDNDFEAYNLLQGVWKDGLKMTQGNEGYNLGNTDFTNYQFNHAENNEGGPWKACDYDGLEQDKRTLVSFGPYNLSKGDIIEFDFTVHFIESENLACPSEAEIMEVCSVIEDVLSEVGNEEIKEQEYKIYPNPINNMFQIESEMNFDNILIYSFNGELLYDIDCKKSHSYQVDCSDWTGGLYYISLKNRGQFLGSPQKLVKI